jgi:hypothetical protein
MVFADPTVGYWSSNRYAPLDRDGGGRGRTEPALNGGNPAGNGGESAQASVANDERMEDVEDVHGGTEWKLVKPKRTDKKESSANEEAISSIYRAAGPIVEGARGYGVTRDIVMRAEFNVGEEDPEFNPRAAMRAVFNETWLVDGAAVFKSTKADDDRVVRQMEDFPEDAASGRSFFAMEKVAMGKVTRYTIVYKMETKLNVHQFKQDSRFFKFLVRNKVFLWEHGFKAITVQPIGWFSQRDIWKTDRAQAVIDLMDELKKVTEQINANNAGGRKGAKDVDVPNFEIGTTKVIQRVVSPEGKEMKPLDGEALEIKCEFKNAYLLRELLMAANLDERRFGVFVPYQSRPKAEACLQLLSAQNEFMNELAVIFVFGLHPQVLQCKVECPLTGEEGTVEELLRGAACEVEENGRKVAKHVIITIEKTRLWES